MPHPPLNGIVACVFDAYGTLFDLDRITATCREELGERASGLADLWRRKQLEYSWLRSLMGRHTDFWHVTGESLDYSLAALGIADQALRARLMEAYLAPPPFADAQPALEALRTAGFKLAILSNGSPSMLTMATKGAGFVPLFDEVMSVEAVGIYKPHPSVYRMAADRFACQPSQIAFVSANGWDAAGAGAFGFQVAWINRRGLPREALPAADHHEIASLAELPGIVKQ